jgi:hypothetical protein
MTKEELLTDRILTSLLGCCGDEVILYLRTLFNTVDYILWTPGTNIYYTDKSIAQSHRQNGLFNTAQE